MTLHKVAIIGAGPAGCMIARLLHCANIPATIFEAEASLDVRSQGGTLDLNTKTGVAALKEAGLYDQFLKDARFDGEAITVADKKLTKYISMSGSTATSPTRRGRPEIDRAKLRMLLVNSLPKDKIRWSHRLQSIDDDLALHFDTGVEKGFDLIVGADGAWSKVRTFLSPIKPFYSGVGGHSLNITNAKDTAPLTYKLVNRGSLFSFSDGKMIGGQQLGNGSIEVMAWSVRDEDWMQRAAYDVRSGPAVKRALCEQHHDWAPELLNLIKDASDKVIPRSLYMLPVGYRWPHRPSVTLVGDAAHLMTPFGGEGVNLALQDAMKLAHTIIETSKDGGDSEVLRLKVKTFEQDMFVRATRMQRMSDGRMRDMMFTPGAPRSILETWIMKKVQIDMHPLLVPLVAAGVYLYYFFYRLLF